VEPRWAKRTNLISGAEHFGIAKSEADEIISELKATIVER
jgi:hypothetical protein